MNLNASSSPSSSPSSIFLRRSFNSDASLTSLQLQVDGLVTGFVEEATRPTTLGAIMAGGLAYRFARIGVMGASASVPLRWVSYAAGLGSEVTAFEGANRILSRVRGDSSNPNLWNWNGPGGWGQGLATSAITFGTLRSAGFLARAQNPAFQHLLQSTAMVAGHNLAGSLGIAPRPEATLAEQFLHAETTNLQLGAGMGLLHGIAPGIHAWEAGLDLSLQARERGLSGGSRFSFPTPLESRAGVGSGERVTFGSRGRELWGQEAKDLNLEMAGNDNNEDGKGRPPRKSTRRGMERAPTIQNVTGLKGEPLRRLSHAETLEIFSPGNPYQVEGIPRGTRVVRIGGTVAPTRLVGKTLELIEQHVNKESPSLVVHLGENEFEAGVQGVLKIDLNRIFREKELPAGGVIAVLVPKQQKAYLFEREGMFSKMKVVTLQALSASSSEKVWEANTPYGILLMLKSALESKTPVIRYLGDVWVEDSVGEAVTERLTHRYPLPRDQTFTLLLEKTGERMVFFWKENRIRWKTEPANPPPASPSRESSARRARSEAITQPAMRKAGLQAKPPPPLRFAHYEAESELQIFDLMENVFGENAKDRLDTRESGSAFRGNHLARVVIGVLKAGGRKEPFSRKEHKILGEVHHLLEKAYTFFDFGVLENFQERLGRARLRIYQEFVDEYNRIAEEEGGAPLAVLDQMPLNLAGRSVIPHPDHLKEEFLAAVLRKQREMLSPHDVRDLLQDPEALGRVFTQNFTIYLQSFILKVAQVKRLPGVNLNQLFDRSRKDLTGDALRLRDEITFLLKDMQEYRRIMMEGTDGFQRRFLRVPFHQSQLLAQLYDKFHTVLSSGILGETLKQTGLQKVPSLEQLRLLSKPPEKP